MGSKAYLRAETTRPAVRRHRRGANEPAESTFWSDLLRSSPPRPGCPELGERASSHSMIGRCRPGADPALEKARFAGRFDSCQAHVPFAKAIHRGGVSLSSVNAQVTTPTDEPTRRPTFP
jgi:hypothetical protein